MIKTVNYVIINVSDGVSKTAELGHAVEEPCGALKQGQHTVVTQLKQLVERSTADRITLAPRPADAPSIPSKLARAMDI